MKKEDNSTQRIFANLRNLIPYIGALFVVAGVIGLLFIQNPLQTTQDVRSQAATQDQAIRLPSLKPELRTALSVNKTGEIALHLDQNGRVLEKAQVLFELVNKDIEVPEIIVNEGSGFSAESIEIEQTAQGYLISAMAVRNNLNWLVPPEDTSFLRIKIVPKKTGTLGVVFDQNQTFGQTRTLSVLIQVPNNLSYAITGENPPEPTATPSTPPTGTPTPTPIVLSSCNEACKSNSGCKTGLMCWEGFCRNPENVRNISCAAPSQEQTDAVIKQCSQSCNSNADCAVNLRCYEGSCRLATNPSSTSCSATTKKTITPTVPGNAPGTGPTKGESLIEEATKPAEVRTDTNTTNGEAESDSDTAKNGVKSNETLWELAINLLKNTESKFPIFIMLLGLLLLVISAIAAVSAQLKTSKKGVSENPLNSDLENHQKD